MHIKPKYYPYPVIGVDKDSYTDVEFTSAVNVIKEGYNVRFSFETFVNNDEIKAYINNSEMVYVFHIECPQTCFRTVVKTFDEKEELLISDSKINGIVQICSFIALEKDIISYSNSAFGSDYKGFKFDIDKGCIIAVGNETEFNISKVKDDLVNTSSIFTIVPNVDPNEICVKIDLSRKTKIAIVIPEKSCNIYRAMSNMLDIQAVMHSMLIIPALMCTFEELINSKDELYNFEDCRWFRSLRKTCKKFNVELDTNGIANLDPYLVSQQLLNTPLTKALEFLSDGSNDGGIYED